MRTQAIRKVVLLSLGLAAALTMAACTASTPPNSSGAAGGPGPHPSHSAPTKGPGTPTPAATLAGGVLGDVTGDGLADILAIDPAGSLWLYPNTGSAGASMFRGGRSQVGSGWTGVTLAAVAPLYGASRAGLLAIDPKGSLWYYPNTGGSGLSTFKGRVQVGIGWTGYTVAGVPDLYGTGSTGGRIAGILAISPAGVPYEGRSLVYCNNTGGTGLGTFTEAIFIGMGWTGYTADSADINGDGKPDVLAVDPSGNLWLYPNTFRFSIFTPFSGPSRVGSGWTGYQAIVAGQLTSTGPASILAIDRAGDLWFYPNGGGPGTSAFGARVQVGSGWTGYRIN